MPALSTKVGLLDKCAVQQVLTGAFAHYAPGLDHVGSIRNRQRAAQILLDQKNAHSGGIFRDDGIENLGDELWRNPPRGFVEQQELRASRRSMTTRAFWMSAYKQTER
jgi:hypothetical protein